MALSTFRLLVFFLALSMTTGPAFAGGASLSPDAVPLAVGDPMPELAFQVELAPGTAAHLGLDPSVASFGLGDLEADVLVLEVMSMYCPYCQQEAETVNRLVQLVAEQGLSDRIVFVGVAAGNSPFEAKVFVDKYDPSFPIVPDPEYLLHKQLGSVGTPFFYVVDLKGNRPLILKTQLGRMDSMEEFMDDLREAVISE